MKDDVDLDKILDDVFILFELCSKEEELARIKNYFSLPIFRGKFDEHVLNLNKLREDLVYYINSYDNSIRKEVLSNGSK